MAYLKNERLDLGSYTQGNVETEYFTVDQIEEIQVYNTIKKDFVNNLDLQNGQWGRALANFEYVIKGKHENPFAYYYAAVAAGKMNMPKKKEKYFEQYMRIRRHNKVWANLFQRFIDEGVQFDEE